MKIRLLITLSAITLLTTACVTTEQVQPMTSQMATGALTSIATVSASPNANKESYKQAAITGATAGLVNSMTVNSNNNSVNAIANSALVGLATSAVQKGTTKEQMKQSAISGALNGLLNSTINSPQQSTPTQK